MKIKRHLGLIAGALLLIVLSAMLYWTHFLLFHDSHHIFIYLLGDIAFVPIEVLMVTLIIHRLLEARAKRAVLNKMNMAIGAFFSEVGNELLARSTTFLSDSSQLSETLQVSGKWTRKDFAKARNTIRKMSFHVETETPKLAELRTFLLDRRPFLLGLLQNPSLLEHESFTDMLWAVCHLTDELAHRNPLNDLTESDARHVAGDLHRALTTLLLEWVRYLQHLKADYPYLYSLAARLNPFDPEATVEVHET